MTRQLARDVHLHAEEPVPAAKGQLAERRARGCEVEVAVDRDRVVQRVDERPAVADEPEQTAAEALVVVDEIELVATITQVRVDAPAERVRLRKPGAGHDPELLDVGAGTELVRPRHPERVLALVEVEALDLLEGDRRVGDRPRRPGEHRHRVAELGQLSGEVAAVHALTAAVRVAAVDEERDPQGVAGGGRARARKGQIGESA